MKCGSPTTKIYLISIRFLLIKMLDFAKIIGKRRQDTSNASCEVFTNFRKVKMLDQSISFAPVVADKQVEEMVGHFCF